MSRPTLAQQLSERKHGEELDKLSDEEVEALFLPHGFWDHVDDWIFNHLHFIFSLLWRTVNWLRPYSLDTHRRDWRWEGRNLD